MLFAFPHLELEAEDVIAVALEFKLKDDVLQRHSLDYHAARNQAQRANERADLARAAEEVVAKVAFASRND